MSCDRSIATAFKFVEPSQNHPTGSQRSVWSFNRRKMCPTGAVHDVASMYVSTTFCFTPQELPLTCISHKAPIAWPIAKLLDYVLGANEAHTYKKAELKSFLQFHRTGEEPLRDHEIRILNGVLELNTTNVETIMTPMKVWLDL
jgi:Hemolysins and related proteins containing CBS domains